ncbi:hypothetical protein TPHA_0H01800 [Tetrapisispora phaffii CBS 4417]|uniref:MoaB/Mog domain-containing protein n=1 Tax=Tetrapisispora phaffii (strain ATCC 24235 / CBS 4417 / NBRC 1672 / NRRL Y-8282 / UCD 70-5) TaxID=1071381 RepID=G8BX82_TETPH|nr:hypothetical protein TPHA_0H01800 [Tetrapisispora phaffii CBS 4417]CCE64386.1 hypothetical protein TPHA_0H01800 [Tetrapisispora phaffii CBS 4417]
MSIVAAACVIIGDEVLNSKIHDSNSRYFAKYCYNLGIELKEIATIGDDEDIIVETLQRLSKKYDFIVTTGGIGPTHDDITYDAIAKSFNLPCELDLDCKARMTNISNPESKLDSDSLKAHYRMATLPTGKIVENYYLADDLWVPVCCINKQVYIFPGIPQLFIKLLNLLTPILKTTYSIEDNNQDYVRYFVKTSFKESEISTYLRLLQEESSKISKNIKIGSYPHFGHGFNTVSILGTSDFSDYLAKIRDQTIERLNGEQISEAEEERISNDFENQGIKP